MKVSLIMWILATLPIILLLILMVKLKISANIAAPIGLGIALIIGVYFYGAGWKLIAVESGKGIWNTLTILMIIWPAIFIYEVTNEANAFDVIRNGIQSFSPNELIQILAIGWVFVSFLQGITGFGVPVAVGAPLLLGLGVKPLWSVIIPLLGQSWGNTFGTLGVAWNALVMQSGIQESTIINETALWAGLFILIMNVFMGFAICWFYGKFEAIKKGIVSVLAISFIQGGFQLILTQSNPTLSCFISSCFSLFVLFIIGRIKTYKEPWKLENSEIMKRRNLNSEEAATSCNSNLTLHDALFPYYVLTVLTIIVLLIKPINKTLSTWKVGFYFPQTQTYFGVINKEILMYSPLSPLTNSGTFLLIGAIAGYLYFRNKGSILKGRWKNIIKRTTLSTLPSATAVISFVVMSSIMSGTGQTTMLALGISEVTGIFYAVLAPAIGVLGSFMTSSNMSSNILFSKFQYTAASLVGLNESIVLGAQTAGGALGTIISPGKIILGTTTVGIIGKEGEVLRLMLKIVLVLSCLFGVIAFLFS